MGTTEEIIKEILTNALMLRIGNRAVNIIKMRTAEGEFLPGSSADAKNYSTKPFAMPIGAVQKKEILKKIVKGTYKQETQLFTTKAGKLWVVIKLGYRWLREVSGKQTENVDMRWTSMLMRNLKVKNVDPVKGEVEIGHTDFRNEQLARWHNIEGAGKSKKIRKWIGITDEELLKIAEGL